MNQVRLMLIGVGPHAKRIYVPSIKKLEKKFNIDFHLFVELKTNKAELLSYFNSLKIDIHGFFVEPFTTQMPQEVENYLDKYVIEHGINSVIIATEPLSHKEYAKWALKNNLHILMDKPISTRENVVSDIEQAKGLEKDYKELMDLYNPANEKAFIINVQRRYHSGFQFVFDKIKEISSKFDIPVTSIQSTHCDGQWRLPTEIVTQNYHPYNTGYGKGSHSGYHIFDSVYNFYKSGIVQNKKPDSIEAFASFIQPNGFIKQLNSYDYMNIFGDTYQTVSKYPDSELFEKYKNYGELDISAIFRLLKDNINLCNISVNLMHNGFARRNWLLPGKDLYKGNGRVKHEYHNIEQGPFQNIQIHSYQSNDKHDLNTDEDYLLGGNNHFDIYVFRNIGITGDKKPLEVFSIKDIEEYDSNSLVVEQTKQIVVEEFIKYILGHIKKESLLSPIEDHAIPVKLMSMTYQSHVFQNLEKNPIIKSPFNQYIYG